LLGAIFVVLRGHCSFAEKVLHAQTAGAQALLVINSDETYLDMSLGKESGRQTEKYHIPSFLLPQSTGMTLMYDISRWNTFPQGDRLYAGSGGRNFGAATNAWQWVGLDLPPMMGVFVSVSEVAKTIKDQALDRRLLRTANSFVKNLIVITKREYRRLRELSDDKKDTSRAYPRRRIMWGGMRWWCTSKSWQVHFTTQTCCAFGR
jgi:hypothetical protein